MSEQTPNSSEDLSGAEPSMEDILASIRKIISDDEPVALESPEDVPVVSLVDTDVPEGLDDLMRDIHLDSNDLTSDAVMDAALAPDATPSVEVESVDLNIDDVLAGLDEDVLGIEPEVVELAKPDMSSPEAASDDVFDMLSEPMDTETLDVENLMPTSDPIESALPETAPDTVVPTDDNDILDFLDAEIPLDADNLAAQLDVEAVETPIIDDFDDDLEMDALLDDILMAPAEVEAQDVLNTDADATSDMQESSDLDLVKSLMADLADDPDGFETEEDLDALLAIPEVEETAEVEALTTAEPDVEIAHADDIAAADILLEDAAPEAEEDILGEILDMTLEDELQSHPEDVPSANEEYLESLGAVVEAEQENIAENADFDNPDDDLPSLSEIAAAAEADAVAVETPPERLAKAPQAVAATAGLGAVAGLAALGTTALGETPAEAETQTAETYSEPEIPSESTPTQETSMPVQAVKTDAILDDVTEAATAGAFAELNQVVEDKAIFNERGPRIGDLVQEALRPMLKEWLDANLKGIVERAVAKEVKRISSGK